MNDKTEESDDDAAAPTTVTVDNHHIDPLEGTSTDNNCSSIDESSNDSTTSSGKKFSPLGPQKCESCSEVATLSFYKHRQPPNGGKTEDIFKSYCNNCKVFFGMCSKKVRGIQSYVNEDGRLLSNIEKMEYFRSEKCKRSATLLHSANPEEKLKVINSDTSTSGLSEEKEEIIEEDEENDEKMEGDDDESPQKKSSTLKKKPKRRAFVGGKGKKTNWSSKKAKCRIIQSQSTSDPSATKNRENSKPRDCKSKAAPQVIPTEEKKRGRQFKSSPKSCGTSNSQPTSYDAFIKSPVMTAINKTDSFCQTDTDLLLKSTYLKDCFNQTTRETLGEQIAARLNDQPLILKKKFLLMLKTIEEQEKRILKYEENEHKHQEAIQKLREFGRSTRLEFSDKFQCIRADLIERKDEFKAHGAEVAAIMKNQRRQFEISKELMQKKMEDQKLEQGLLQAKVDYIQQELIYEKNRAEFFLRTRDVYEKERNEAIEKADIAVKNLNDRLFLADNETCTRCKTVERIRKKMAAEVAEMTEKSEKAIQEKIDAVERATLFESAAQKLGKDCDSIKYERDSWKAYAERYKKDVMKLTQTIKEKDKEFLEKIAEIANTPKSIQTPRSLLCTPNGSERVSPPEDGEITETPPQGSPRTSIAPQKFVAKPLIQQIAEKKSALPIASNFESWIPKEKLNAPAPEIPKAVSAFGVPLKQSSQKEAEKLKYAPSSQPTPWDKLAKVTSASDSLTEALSKVQADNFMGMGSTISCNSKSYTEEVNRIMKVRKRGAEETIEHPKSATPVTSFTPVKKTKPTSSAPSIAVQSKTSSAAATPSTSVPSTSIGSLSNLKKIPKLSEKPPQAEFAPALGVGRNDNRSEIPGLGMDKLDEKAKEKEKEEIMRKVDPIVVKQSNTTTQEMTAALTTSGISNSQTTTTCNRSKAAISKQKKINSPPKKKPNNKLASRNDKTFAQAAPWQRSHHHSPPDNQPLWRQQQPQYGIQSNQQRSFQVDLGLDRPWSDSVSSARNDVGRQNESFSHLPWHRSQDTPFGKVPIQDNFSMSTPRPMPPQMHSLDSHQPSSFYDSPRDNSLFPQARDFSSPQPSMQPRMFSPPSFGYSGRGNPRSFYG